MGDHNALFAAEVIECVADDRPPTDQELYAVAERIGRECGMGPVFAWGDTVPGSPAQRYLLRAAQVALRGAEPPSPAKA